MYLDPLFRGAKLKGIQCSRSSISSNETDGQPIYMVKISSAVVVPKSPPQMVPYTGHLAYHVTSKVLLLPSPTAAIWSIGPSSFSSLPV